MVTIEFKQDLPSLQIITAPALTVKLPQAPKLYYRHGWQSWSLAAWTDAVPLPIQKPHILHPMQADPVYSKEKRPHSSWVGAVEFDDGHILLLGSLGLNAHVILNGSRLEGKYESGDGEWFIAHGDESTVFSKYATELGKRLGTKPNKPAPRVWCSWYSLYSAIDESLLYKIFDDLGDLPFDVLQVDDGWQVSVGDWEANKEFPSDMKALANKIKSTGRKAGLWLAPLIAVKSSKLFREHPDWFLRNEQERLISAGFNWGEELYALDTTHPAVIKWLSELIKKVRSWGFDYIKLDFLYGGALAGRRHQDIPRETAYRQGLEVIREALGSDAYLLTCGAPIIPSIGLCDALRVGPDVASIWEAHRDAVLLYNPAIPAAKNAIRTTLNRLWLNPLAQIDPDVVYFRLKECRLEPAQRSLLQDLAFICNFKATSDLPQWLTPYEKESLRAFLKTNPDIKQKSRYVFQVSGREVDFSSAISIPQSPKGFESFVSNLFGWLANHKWVLKINDGSAKKALRKMKKDLH